MCKNKPVYCSLLLRRYTSSKNHFWISLSSVLFARINIKVIVNKVIEGAVRPARIFVIGASSIPEFFKLCLNM